MSYGTPDGHPGHAPSYGDVTARLPAQRAGYQTEELRVLLSLSRLEEENAYECIPPLPQPDRIRVCERDRVSGTDYATPVETRKVTPGALAADYALPRVRYRGSFAPWLVCVSILLAGRMLDHAYGLERQGPYLRGVFLVVLLLSVSFAVFQQLISWTDRPRRVTARQEQQLEALRVVVAIPVYNEDPQLLDRAIWSLFNGSRLPHVIHVVEDGEQAVDYDLLRDHWTSRPGLEVIWTRNPVNQGKKWAQADVFGSHPDADIFITIDSDTALEYEAIREGLKPFADKAVTSVAGIEVMYNAHKNWLTWSVTTRNIIYQLVTWGTQSAVGDLLVNRGTYALYRAWVIREIIPAYVGETFLGHQIKLGDDAALALFARGRGRTVQQVTAFCLPMCAETLSHHFRQFTRWMRGKAIRDEWRLRYLPLRSYGWLYTVFTIFTCLASTAGTIVLLASLPSSLWLLRYSLTVMILASLVTGTRVFCIQRSDESPWDRIISWLLYPTALLWVLFVLRPLRFYGAATVFRQGWVTRQAGVEVAMEAAMEHSPQTMMREPEEAIA